MVRCTPKTNQQMMDTPTGERTTITILAALLDIFCVTLHSEPWASCSSFFFVFNNNSVATLQLQQNCKLEYMTSCGHLCIVVKYLTCIRGHATEKTSGIAHQLRNQASSHVDFQVVFFDSNDGNFLLLQPLDFFQGPCLSQPQKQPTFLFTL